MLFVFGIFEFAYILAFRIARLLKSKKNDFYRGFFSNRSLEKYGKFPKLIHDLFVFRNVGSQEVKEGEQQLSPQTRRSPLGIPKSQGFRETCRDALGCVFVILVSLLVYFTDSGVAKYIDPLFAIISSISLFALSYSYSKSIKMQICNREFDNGKTTIALCF